MKYLKVCTILLSLLLWGCPIPEGTSSLPETYISVEITSVTTGFDANVNIIKDYGSATQTGESGATVEVDSTNVPYSSGSLYTLNFPGIAANDVVPVSVTLNSINASDSITVPNLVTLTAPSTSGTLPNLEITSHNVATPMVLTWNTISGVDQIEIFIDKLSTAGQTTDYSVILNGSETTHTIPANTLETPDASTFVIIKIRKVKDISASSISSDSKVEATNNLKLHVNYNPV